MREPIRGWAVQAQLTCQPSHGNEQARTSSMQESKTLQSSGPPGTRIIGFCTAAWYFDSSPQCPGSPDQRSPVFGSLGGSALRRGEFFGTSCGLSTALPSLAESLRPQIFGESPEWFHLVDLGVSISTCKLPRQAA